MQFLAVDPLESPGARRLIAMLAVVLSCFYATANLNANESSNSRTNDPTEAAKEIDLTAARQKVQDRIAELQSEISTRVSPRPSESLGFELDLLSWLDLTYSQLQSLQEQNETVLSEKARLEDELNDLAKFGIGEEPPFSFLLLDDLAGQITLQKDRLDALNSRGLSLQEAMENAENDLRQFESKRRQVEEALNAASSGTSKLAKQSSLEKTLLQVEARTAAVSQINQEQVLNDLEIEAQELRVQILESKHAIVSQDVRFIESDLDARLHLIEQAEIQLQTELSEKLRSLACPENKAAIASSSADINAKLHDQPLCRMRMEIHQKEVAFIRQLQRKLVEMRAAWRWRYEIANDLMSVQQLHEVDKMLTEACERLASVSDLLEVRLNEIQDALLVFRKLKLEVGQNDSAETQEAQAKIELLEESANNLNSYISLVRAGQRLLDRAESESSAAMAPSDTRVFLSSVSYWAKHVWNYEITVVDDRSVTVGKILSALGLLLGSLLLARILSRILGNRVLPRLGVNTAGATALQSLAFYVLLVCFSFMILDFVNVPLTGFAFMGGAIAIGIGFGSQNIINNFISGLIILAERPIRHGDLVEINGLLANVQHIGARSTRVRTGANLEIVVPNSKFLENNVANWTLSSTRIRVSVNVGVAYGSDPKRVMEILQEAASEHPGVQKTPQPIILFKEFGDNALQFECHFWIHMQTMMEGERIRSDVRCRIDKLLDDANITIAFPQRDIHIDTIQPLDINVRQIDGLAVSNRRRAA